MASAVPERLDAAAGPAGASAAAGPAGASAATTPAGSSVASRPLWWWELLLGLGLFALYGLGADSAGPGRTALATAHARTLFELEKVLHLDVELTLNQWLAGQPVLSVVCNYEYATTYVITALALLVWVYLRCPDQYRRVRTSFLLLNLIGVGCFAVYPVAPPRLLPEWGFVDTVRLGETWGSWGSPMLTHANQLAAMPSLHLAWALWVSIVLAHSARGWAVQTLGGLHVAVTLVVILATANHFLVDAVAGALLAWLSVAAARWVDAYRSSVRARSRPERVHAADAFFLHVESPSAPQQVGGVVVVDCADRWPTATKLAAEIAANLDHLPRFRQRLVGPGRWRRARWLPHLELDWDWHVPTFDLTGPDGRCGGIPALSELVARLAGHQLPRDRPLWRFALVRGFAPDKMAGILIVHHVVADGLGTVALAQHVLRPLVESVELSGPLATTSPRPRPGVVRRTGGIMLGLAQLATDSRPGQLLPASARWASVRLGEPAQAVADAPMERIGPADRIGPVNVVASGCSAGVARPAERRFVTVTLPLAAVRRVARRQGVRVTDVVLCAVAGALHRAVPDPAALPVRLRVAVPLMASPPGGSGDGNRTAAVLMNLPLGPLSAAQRLTRIARESQRMRTASRALASRFVMQTVGRAAPPLAHGWFARAVYGQRFFQAIVSNMPGPGVTLGLAGAPVEFAFPLLPLAPHAPLAVGALGWGETLCLGVSVDPAVLTDTEAFAAGMVEVVRELGGGVGVAQATASVRRSRAVGSSSAAPSSSRS